MKRAWLAFLVGAGCMVGEGSTDQGSEGSAGEEMTGEEMTGEEMTGAACTGAVYDPCTDNAQCESNNCRLFEQAGIQVCTQACTPGDNTTCPQQNGQPAQCNNMGICKPMAANSCTR